MSLLVTGKFEMDNCRTLEKIAATEVTWGDKYALMFDNLKTELMHSHQKRMADTDTTVEIPDRTIITPETVLRWLGVFKQIQEA